VPPLATGYVVTAQSMSWTIAALVVAGYVGARASAVTAGGPVPGHASTSPRLVANPRVETAPGDVAGWSAELSLAGQRARRHVSIPDDTRLLVVRDTLQAATAPDGLAARRRHPGGPAPVVVPGEVTLRWQLGGGVRSVTPHDSTEAQTWAWRIQTGSGRRFDVTVRVVAEPPVTAGASLIAGEKAPLDGWYSPGQFIARPAPVIRVRVGGPGVVETRVRELPRLRDMRRR